MMYVVIMMASFTLGFVLVIVAGLWIADRQARREDEARATAWLATATPAASGTGIDQAARWVSASAPGVPIYRDDQVEPIAYVPRYLAVQQYDDVLDKHRLRQPERPPLWPDDELRRAEAERSNL